MFKTNKRKTKIPPDGCMCVCDKLKDGNEWTLSIQPFQTFKGTQSEKLVNN